METKSRTTSKQTEASKRLTKISVIHSSILPLGGNMTGSRAKGPLMKRLMRWLFPDQRVANRHAMPPLVAYLGLLRSSRGYKIGNISVAGFYMITDEKWIPGTGLPVTLERIDVSGKGQTLTAFSTVVRTGADGVGFTFMQPASDEGNSTEDRGTSRLDMTKLAQFLKGIPLSEPNYEALERAS